MRRWSLVASMSVLVLAGLGATAAPAPASGRKLAGAPAKKGTLPALALAVAVPRPLRLVCIDAGHGGEVEGAIGWSGLKEKEVALDVALRTGRALEALGYAVMYTRSGDVDVPLAERPLAANRAGADLFVSIHANAEPSRKASGFETYHLSTEASDGTARRLALRENAVLAAMGAPVLDSGALGLILADLAVTEARADSAHLATSVQFQLAVVLDTENRGVKQAPLAVLAAAVMPAVLVEVGFVTSKTEAKLLGRPAYRDSIARAIARGVARHDELTARRLAGAPGE